MRFRTIPSVDDVVVTDGRITVRGSETNLVTEVIRCISESGMQVTDFRTVLPTLEDVFLKVTGHSIRD
jgi:ABC-2 type transport system ATP-binding protein